MDDGWDYPVSHIQLDNDDPELIPVNNTENYQY